MSFKLTSVLLIVQICSIYSAYLPVEKCQLTEPACLKAQSQKAVTAFVAGIPELGNEVLDPMHIDQVNVELAGLKLVMKSLVLKGLRKSIIDKLSIDLKKKKFQIKLHTDVLLKSKYVASGRLLILPISGDGDLTFKLKNLQLDVSAPIEVKKDANGKDIIVIKDHTFKFDVKDNAHFHLTNLFNGNKELSDAMLRFMNENWKQLVDEFGRPITAAAVEVAVKNIKNYLEKQPIEEITL